MFNWLFQPIVVMYEVQLAMQKAHYDRLLAQEKARADYFQAHSKFLEEKIKFLERTQWNNITTSPSTSKH